MLYRSKPQLVEAIQWTGDNYRAVHDFGASIKLEFGCLYVEAGKTGAQGYVPVPLGHWIIRQPDDLSDHWPVDPHYFAAKYELA
ncbi:MAG: hypothetical protein LC650_00530 [Actinobacteria bacterium]|nr:hypothetical protein [Actinomycetota bacterium]